MPSAADLRRASSVLEPFGRSCVVALIAARTILSSTGTPQEQFAFTKNDEIVLESGTAAEAAWIRHGIAYQDDALIAYIGEVAKPMLPEETPARVTWRFGVQRDPMPNAYALPSGAIYITSGMLALLQTEDQLAATIGHEIGHVTGRHAYLHTRQARKKALASNLVLLASAAALPAGAPWTYTGWGMSLKAVADVVPWLLEVSSEGYGRDNERAADAHSIERLGPAHFDPAALEQMLVVLRSQLDDPALANHHGTHPALNERISTAARLARTLRGSFSAAASGEHHERYLATVTGIKRHNVSLDIAAGRFHVAALHAKALLARERSPDALCLLADVYREAGPYPAEPPPSASRPETKRSGPPKRTREEERAKLLKSKDGRAVWGANVRNAEGLYLEARAIAPDSASAALGLGSLYEQAGDAARALREYRRYLELAGQTPDRRRIELRVERLSKTVRIR